MDRLILDAARGLFSTNGYVGTSMREIAERAGVRQPMLYRRHRSKAALFASAVLDPLDEAVTRYLDVWSAQVEEAGPTESLTRAWVPALYSILRDERQSILALMGAQEYRDQGLEDLLGARLRQIVTRMLPQARLEIERRPLHGVVLPDNIVVSLGMILGVALMDAEREFDLPSERVVEELVQMTLYGVSGRGPGATGAASRGFAPADIAPADIAPSDIAPAEIDELLDRAADAERRAVRAELERDLLRRRLDALEGRKRSRSNP